MWISVKDRLPSGYWTVPVLVNNHENLVQYSAIFNPMGKWEDIRGWGYKKIDDSFIPYIEYWFELPEPPEKDNG